MGVMAVTGAKLMCTFGSASSDLIVTSQKKVLANGKPIGTVADILPGNNIPSFGMCISMGNPQVAAATAAALGVLTPQPCTLIPSGTWVSGSPQCVIDGKPCLCTGSTLTCAMGMGSIFITNPGQMKITAS